MKSEQGRILVTGATGFIGKALVQELIAQGFTVRGLGRNLERGMELESMGAEFRPVDLCDKPAMIRACHNIDAVVHAGALASPWGRTDDFDAINIGGTANVIAGCRSHGVDRLVYISSPSVTSAFEDQFDLDENHRPKPEFVSDYSRTKWEGEELVRRAHGPELETVIIRPKAVYGPGDTQIVPRILKAAKRGVFPVFGDEKTMVNITYIDDVVRGIRLALEAPEANGNTYVLTGDEDVDIQEVVGDLLTRLGEDVRKLPVRTGVAMNSAAICEGLWKLLPLGGEPPLTRYTVGMFAYSQTYDISAARRDLGYEPQVSIAQGMEEVAKFYENSGASNGGDESQTVESAPANIEATALPVELDMMVAGTCTAPGIAFYPGGGMESLQIPALFGLIEHPERGRILFDTGYSERFFEATRRYPARLFRWLTPATVDRSTSAAGRLRARGIDPESIETILLSHFDPDHYGGLRDFPNARIICTASAWAAVRGKEGIQALKARILPGHFPDDLTARLSLLPTFEGPSIGPFENSHDIFGDGSLRAVSLPGHAPGQYGIFLQKPDGQRIFLAADGCWTRRCLRDEKLRGQAHALIADDRRAQKNTYRLLGRLCREMPEVSIIPCHCPEAAREFSDFGDPTEQL